MGVLNFTFVSCCDVHSFYFGETLTSCNKVKVFMCLVCNDDRKWLCTDGSFLQLLHNKSICDWRDQEARRGCELSDWSTATNRLQLYLRKDASFIMSDHPASLNASLLSLDEERKQHTHGGGVSLVQTQLSLDPDWTTTFTVPLPISLPQIQADR